jgi:spore germination cell wall hydrolase CwlJ-like protein
MNTTNPRLNAGHIGCDALRASPLYKIAAVAAMAASVVMITALAGCEPTDDTQQDSGLPTAFATPLLDEKPAPTPEDAPVPETPSALQVSDAEIELVAKTLRGECYDDEIDDKRGVARVICNRVSAGRFGATIEEVVTAPAQFSGYRANNVPTVNDYAIAREVLTEWYVGGCKQLDGSFYFSAGGGRTNVFYEQWEGN